MGLLAGAIDYHVVIEVLHTRDALQGLTYSILEDFSSRWYTKIPMLVSTQPKVCGKGGDVSAIWVQFELVVACIKIQFEKNFCTIEVTSSIVGVMWHPLSRSMGFLWLGCYTLVWLSTCLSFPLAEQFAFWGYLPPQFLHCAFVVFSSLTAAVTSSMPSACCSKISNILLRSNSYLMSYLVPLVNFCVVLTLCNSVLTVLWSQCQHPQIYSLWLAYKT